MTRDEIKELIRSNEAIARAYKEFKKKCCYSKIIDMYAMMHINLPYDEAYIVYEDLQGNKRRFNFMAECR